MNSVFMNLPTFTRTVTCDTVSWSDHFLTFRWIILLPTSGSSSEKRDFFHKQPLRLFPILARTYICSTLILRNIRVYLRFHSCTKLQRFAMSVAFLILTSEPVHEYSENFIRRLLQGLYCTIAVCNFVSTRSSYYLANSADRQKGWRNSG